MDKQIVENVRSNVIGSILGGASNIGESIGGVLPANVRGFLIIITILGIIWILIYYSSNIRDKCIDTYSRLTDSTDVYNNKRLLRLQLELEEIDAQIKKIEQKRKLLLEDKNKLKSASIPISVQNDVDLL